MQSDIVGLHRMRVSASLPSMPSLLTSFIARCSLLFASGLFSRSFLVSDGPLLLVAPLHLGRLGTRVGAEALCGMLHNLFSDFDEIAEGLGVSKASRNSGRGPLVCFQKTGHVCGAGREGPRPVPAIALALPITHVVCPFPPLADRDHRRRVPGGHRLHPARGGVGAGERAARGAPRGRAAGLLRELYRARRLLPPHAHRPRHRPRHGRRRRRDHAALSLVRPSYTRGARKGGEFACMEDGGP